MASSFFSEPDDHLDPALFLDGKMAPALRDELLGKSISALSTRFMGAEQWSKAWVAGSGASYRWRASRSPGDLDVLVGIDYVQFRDMNRAYAGLSDAEISAEMNDLFRDELQPSMSSWNGWEVTFYVNPNSHDITNIHPYAAYNLTDDQWDVEPTKDPPQIHPQWKQKAEEMHGHATTAVQWYAKSLQDLENAPNDAYRRNAEQTMHNSLEQASALYDEVHQGRKAAFGPEGQGYDDPYNYLWQHGKENGWLEPLKTLKKYRDDLASSRNISTYGVEMPEADTLIRRAATAYSNSYLI